MARTTKMLTALEVERIKEPGRHPVGPAGLYLQIIAGSRSWVYRYTMAGKERWAGLGSTDAVSLKDAREKRETMRGKIAARVDPVAERKQERATALAVRTPAKPFRKVAAEYIALHEGGWRNAKHRYQWNATLEQYAFPIIGDLPCDQIETAHIHAIMLPIWNAKRETARRLLNRIKRILDNAKTLGLRGGENPATWTGHLSTVFPGKKKNAVEHHAAMAYRDVPGFMGALRQREGIAARALEVLVLTAARTAETTGATWDEIQGSVWTIPASRMKGGVQHKVPLSARAVEIIAEMRQLKMSALVFPGMRGELSNMSMAAVLKRMGHGDVTVHGFRSAFKDWCSEETHFPNVVSEMALAHAIDNKVEAAYRRGDLFAKRVKLMDAWSAYCARPAVSAEVVPLHAAG